MNGGILAEFLGVWSGGVDGLVWKRDVPKCTFYLVHFRPKVIGKQKFSHFVKQADFLKEFSLILFAFENRNTTLLKLAEISLIFGVQLVAEYPPLHLLFPWFICEAEFSIHLPISLCRNYFFFCSIVQAEALSSQIFFFSS